MDSLRLASVEASGHIERTSSVSAPTVKSPAAGPLRKPVKVSQRTPPVPGGECIHYRRLLRFRLRYPRRLMEPILLRRRVERAREME